MRETLTLSPLVMVRLGSINCSPIEDDEAYELIQVIDWLLEHEILLDNEEIFDLWAVEDSRGLPEPPPFPAPTHRIGGYTGINGFDYEPDRPYVCQIATII